MPDIVDLAISAGNFKTLVAAIQAAGLVDTLKGPGPYTVFAPTDEAFAKLPKATVDNLLKDPPRLRSLLLYHVIPGKITGADMRDMRNAKTVEGETVDIDGVRWHLHRHIKVNRATIVQADIIADNGVCHAIDEVLMPKNLVVTPTPMR